MHSTFCPGMSIYKLCSAHQSLLHQQTCMFHSCWKLGTSCSKRLRSTRCHQPGSSTNLAARSSTKLAVYTPCKRCNHPATRGLLQVTELNVTTPSTVPPSFTVTAVSNYTEGNAILTVATNETATVYYMVLLGQATSIPTASQVCAPAACSIAVVLLFWKSTPMLTAHLVMLVTQQCLQPAALPAL